MFEFGRRLLRHSKQRALAIMTHPPLDSIGKIASARGTVCIVRACNRLDRLAPHDPVYGGDAVETGPDGAVCLLLCDGTILQLGENSQLELNEYNFDQREILGTARIKIVTGKFAILAGKLAQIGALTIETPFSRIRGSLQGGGVGLVTLTALFFSVVRDAHALDAHAFNETSAFSQTSALLDDGVNTYKDLEHGVYILETNDGKIITVDDPSQTVILEPSGSSVSVSVVSNSLTQMANLDEAYQGTFQTFSKGLQDVVPQSTTNGGSSTSPDLLEQNHHGVADRQRRRPSPAYIDPDHDHDATFDRLA